MHLKNVQTNDLPLIWCGSQKRGVPAQVLSLSLYNRSKLQGPQRKHIFGDGSKDVQLSYEDYLRRTMFSSIDRVIAEIRERFQQLQNRT
ncbi:hypothetical protein TNCV_3224501 [Trichonephila clavipes]|nr:hypothetical protein TNCV_3224501 [Trichonephila clavipes]